MQNICPQKGKRDKPLKIALPVKKCHLHTTSGQYKNDNCRYVEKKTAKKRQSSNKTISFLFYGF